MSTHITVFPNAVIYKGKNLKLGSIDMPIAQARALRLETMADTYHPETPYKIMATNEDGSYFFAEYSTMNELQLDRNVFFRDLEEYENEERIRMERELRFLNNMKAHAQETQKPL